MICVSIARGRHKQVKAEHRHLAEQGAELVELRLDYIRREISLKRLLRDRPTPVIITCRRESEHGKWEGSEEARLMLLRSAIAEGVEYVDLEEDVAAGIPRYGKTRRIISLHNFRETPEDLVAIQRRLAALDADIVKIATMANSVHDNLRMLQMVEQAEVPTIGICMGEIGTPSRLLAGRHGAPFTYATFHLERTLAPGQLSFRQMVDIYHYDQIGPQTELFGVVADPIGHSLSPLVHNACFRACQMDRAYLPLRVPRGQLAAFMQDARALGLRGLSVTIPHKETMRAHLTRIENAAEKIGAVNTVVFEPDGAEVAGYNTDHLAAMASLIRATGVRGDDNPLAGRTALILGAGGVAKAIAYGLSTRDVTIKIASRTFSRAEELAAQFEGDAIPWDDRHLIKPDFLINCTPVGMHPNVDESPFDAQHLRRRMVVFDTVYNPEQTLLIKQAREQNCRIATGVDMFVRQAQLQFKLFTGQEAPSDLMRQQIKRAIGAAKP